MTQKLIKRFKDVSSLEKQNNRIDQRYIVAVGSFDGYNHYEYEDAHYYQEFGWI